MNKILVVMKNLIISSNVTFCAITFHNYSINKIINSLVKRIKCYFFQITWKDIKWLFLTLSLQKKKEKLSSKKLNLTLILHKKHPLQISLREICIGKWILTLSMYHFNKTCLFQSQLHQLNLQGRKIMLKAKKKEKLLCQNQANSGGR